PAAEREYDHHLGGHEPEAELLEPTASGSPNAHLAQPCHSAVSYRGRWRHAFCRYDCGSEGRENESAGSVYPRRRPGLGGGLEQPAKMRTAMRRASLGAEPGAAEDRGRSGSFGVQCGSAAPASERVVRPQEGLQMRSLAVRVLRIRTC